MCLSLNDTGLNTTDAGFDLVKHTISKNCNINPGNTKLKKYSQNLYSYSTNKLDETLLV